MISANRGGNSEVRRVVSGNMEVVMTWRRNVLIVANVTAASPQLVDILKQREPATFTLIVPATPFGGGRETALQTLEEALSELRAAGLEVEGSVGHPDPIIAGTDLWDPR